jgi:DNA-binding transcriptional MocR family regulator
MPSRAHPRPYHRDSLFGDGPRIPLDRERRAVWKARMEMHRRVGRITDSGAQVGTALLRRLGQDGRCDPSHQTLADDSGESVSTVQRALKALAACGLVSWVRRIIREGWRACQTSNAYLLTAGDPPRIQPPSCDGQSDRGTKKDRYSTVQPASAPASKADREALERRARERQAAFNTAWLNRKATPAG